MNPNLREVARKFAQYRGQRKKVRYPSSLWEEARKLCDAYSISELTRHLKVGRATLLNHTKQPKNPSFVPVTVSMPSVTKIHLTGTCPITVEFSGSVKELAELVTSIQGDSPC